MQMLEAAVDTAFEGSDPVDKAIEWHEQELHSAQSIGATAIVKVIKEKGNIKPLLIIPESARSSVEETKYILGVVLSTGFVPEVSSFKEGEKRDTHCVKIGDIIQFPAYGNMEVMGDKDFLIVNETNIIAFWEAKTIQEIQDRIRK